MSKLAKRYISSFDFGDHDFCPTLDLSTGHPPGRAPTANYMLLDWGLTQDEVAKLDSITLLRQMVWKGDLTHLRHLQDSEDELFASARKRIMQNNPASPAVTGCFYTPNVNFNIHVDDDLGAAVSNAIIKCMRQGGSINEVLLTAILVTKYHIEAALKSRFATTWTSQCLHVKDVVWGGREIYFSFSKHQDDALTVAERVKSKEWRVMGKSKTPITTPSEITGFVLKFYDEVMEWTKGTM